MKSNNTYLYAGLVGLAYLLYRGARSKRTEDIGRIKRRIYVEIEAAQNRGIPMGEKYINLTVANQRDLKEIGESFGWKQSSRSVASGKSYSEAYFNSLKRAYNAITGLGVSGAEHTVRNDNGDVVLTWMDMEAAAEHTAAEKRLEETEKRLAEMRRKQRAERRKTPEQRFQEMKQAATLERQKTIQDEILERWPWLKTWVPETGWEIRNDFQYVIWMQQKNRAGEVLLEGPKSAYLSMEDAQDNLEGKQRKTIKMQWNDSFHKDRTPHSTILEKIVDVRKVNLNNIAGCYSIGALFGGNSGYSGYSMSKRAIEARSEGRFPKTDFCRYYDVTRNSLDALVHLDLIDNSEWHHTSKFGNRTTFYSWADAEDDTPVIREIYKQHKKEIDAAAKNGNLVHIRNLFNQYDGASDYVRDFVEIVFPYSQTGYTIQAVGGRISYSYFYLIEGYGGKYTFGDIQDGETIHIDNLTPDQYLRVNVNGNAEGFIINGENFL